VVTLTVTQAPLPTVLAIDNGASYAQGAIAPGEIVTVWGANIGPAQAIGLQIGSDGKVATKAGSTTVTFNGVPAPIIYAGANQINVIVPYEVSGATSANVVVSNNGQSSMAFQVNVAPSAPAIFALGQNGSGQGAIINEDNTLNGAANPATRGKTIVSIYATGEGMITPSGVTGSITSLDAPYPTPNLPVTVKIGGVQAQTTYVGEAPGLVSGVMQINAVIPDGIGTGDQIVTISVGGATSPAVVTVAVK
jgi:trimeric autotransporter adhesin